MWLRREKVGFGEAWHPDSKKAAGETGQRDTSTKQQKHGRAGAGECSICRDTPGRGEGSAPSAWGSSQSILGFMQTTRNWLLFLP